MRGVTAGPRPFRALFAAGAVIACGLLTASPAAAHPLGNFTINHYDGLTLHADHIDDLSVVDSAEIPTLQEHIVPGLPPDAVRSRCVTAAAALDLQVDGRTVRWKVVASSLVLKPGAAGLPTSRLTCSLSAALDTGRGLDRAGGSDVEFADGYRGDRIGWRETTAVAQGVTVERSSVPARTVSDELRQYPNDLLTSPLNIRTASIRTGPGPARASAPAAFVVSAAGPFSRALAQVNSTVDSLVGAERLSIGVVLLAMILSLVLGASHAALPGHGKTVMAAYLAGRGGGIRDAVTVGATVTATHTAGVIVLGVLLSTTARFAGENILGWLGAISGAMIAFIGAGLLRGAWRDWRLRRSVTGHSHEYGHGHDHGHSHGHGHGHGHGHSHDHGGGHAHDNSPEGHVHGSRQAHDGLADDDHSHDRSHSHSHSHAPGVTRLRRRALIGMGVAGGLVPSPSALVVLLGAIALGRTAFGIALVLGYGLGMAMTLTAAGLLLIRLRDRTLGAGAGLTRLATRISGIAPLATAALVLIVGSGLALRSLPIVT